jgi:beta-glucanase (GH16 family)
MRALPLRLTGARRRGLRAGIAFGAVVLAATAVIAGSAGPASAVSAPAGWTTVFGDDFNGTAGTGLNRSDWIYDLGHGYTSNNNWGTGEIETMTDSTANVYQDGGGHLAIKPIRDGAGNWTSGRVETQRTDFQPPAGGVLRIEASIQQPNVTGAAAAGYWPAFWALGAPARANGAAGWPAIGEIDILESVNGEQAVYGTLHCGTNPGGPCNETTGLGSGQHAVPGAGTGFHQYAVEWDRSISPQQIRWYVDGANYFTINQDKVDATTWTNATGHGFFPILNVAIGGGWPGSPTGATVSGAPMLVDYVGVYSKTAGGTTTPPVTTPGSTTGTNRITGYGGKCIDVAQADTADGTAIQLYTCNGTPAQTWTINADGSVKALGKCLDVTGGATADATKVQLYTCNGTGAQKWTLNAAHDLVNLAANKCLDATGPSSEDRTRLQIWTCTGTPNQKWTLAG